MYREQYGEFILPRLKNWVFYGLEAILDKLLSWLSHIIIYSMYFKGAESPNILIF